MTPADPRLCALILALGATPSLAQAQTRRPPRILDGGMLGFRVDGIGDFGFASYGRVMPNWNLRGGSGRPANLVRHGTRLEESPYLELDFYYRRSANVPSGPPLQFKVVTTIAATGTPFHYTGEWDVDFAIRNLYAELSNLASGRLSVWAGSRMYRGNQIYLFDYFILDNLNTYGGGVQVALGRGETALDIAAHVGVNRLSSEFQFQEVAVPSLGFGADTVEFLNRQRTIASLRAELRRPLFEGGGWKVRLYGEFHALPEGELLGDDAGEVEILPPDNGFVVGGQFGLWNGQGSWLNVFVRYAGGLAAYGEMGIPFGVNIDRRAQGAGEFVVGVDANVEISRVAGVLVGAYLRRFVDADPNIYDWDDRLEYIVAARPIFYVGRFFRPAMEISVQGLASGGLAPTTGTPLSPHVVKISALPSLALDRGSLSRPELRLIYSASILDEDARATYNADDPRRDIAVQHYLGIGAEWWFGIQRD